MSAAVRMPLAVAASAAARLRDIIEPGATRIEVAGSIRRRRADIGDIELVAVPILEAQPSGFFESRVANKLTDLVDWLVRSDVLAHHPTDPKRGERYSKLLDPVSGLQVDLFSATADSFGLIYLIRTGPADYSRGFVTDLRKRGLHVGAGQLHRGGLGCGTSPCEVIPTPEERDVYAAAGWPFIKPELRA